jgi:glycosyltransferase involved in cell wall biosynthesis
MPKVSVIIPTYNRANLIAESIKSVLNQTFTDFEIIVVDDGSADNTKEVVESFKEPRIRYIYQANKGVSCARNVGIFASKGEYIAFLDSDDIWLPQNLELKIKLLDTCPNIPLVCSDMAFFRNDTDTIISRLWQKRSNHYLRGLRDGSRQPLTEFLAHGLFTVPTTVMRRCVLDQIGYFDESLSNAEDFEILIRTLYKFSPGIINLPLLKYRIHGNNLSRNYEKTYPGTIGSINKIIKSNTLSKKNLKLMMRNKLAHTHLNYAWKKIKAGETTVGREKLIIAIKINPLVIKPYIYYVLSFLGNGSIKITVKISEFAKNFFTWTSSHLKWFVAQISSLVRAKSSEYNEQQAR